MAASEVAGLVVWVRNNVGLTTVTPPPLPAKATFPFVTIHEVMGISLENLDGPSNVMRTLMQINVWSPDYESMWTLRGQIREGLQAFTGDCGNGRIIMAVNHGAGFGAGDAELYDTARMLHQGICRLQVWWEV